MFYELCLFNALVGLRGCFYEQNGNPFTPCKLSDEKCFKGLIEKFLTDWAHGNPQYGLKALDPLVIPDFDYDVPNDVGITNYLKNTKVSGIKNTKICNIVIDTINQRVTIEANFTVHIVSDLNVIIKGKPPLKSGLEINGETEATISFEYTIEKHDTGLQYLVPGEDTTTYLFDEAPTYIVDDELIKTMDIDPVMSPKLKKVLDNIDYYVKYMTTEILKRASPSVMDNIRQLYKIVPMSSFV